MKSEEHKWFKTKQKTCIVNRNILPHHNLQIKLKNTYASKQNLTLKVAIGILLPHWLKTRWYGQNNKNKNAPAGNRTRVCTVAGYYSTTRPLVLDVSICSSNIITKVRTYYFVKKLKRGKKFRKSLKNLLVLYL